MGMNYTCVLLSVAPLLYLLSDLLPPPPPFPMYSICTYRLETLHILDPSLLSFLVVLLDEGFKHRLHSPQLSAVQLTQLGLPQTRPRLQCKGAVFRIHDILGWIRIRNLGYMLPTGGSGSGFWIQMLLFSLTFQMPAKI